MKHNAISLISRIRENANRLIIKELHNAGMPELAPSHGDILAALYSAGEMTMLEIAKKIHRTKATTTVLIQKLENNGLVTRQKSAIDSRSTIVSLTQKGRNFKKIFNQISEKLNSTVYKNLTKDECDTIEILLSKMQNNFE